MAGLQGMGGLGVFPGYAKAAKAAKPAKTTAAKATPAKATAAKPVSPIAAPTPWDPWVQTVMGSVQTPQQIRDQSRTWALADEKAVLAAQKAVSDQAIAAYHDQSARSQGFARALGQLQAGEDQQAQARYGDAANLLSGIGTGLTGAVSEQYQGSVDAAKAAVDRLTGGLGQVTAPEAGDLRNAAQYAGVTGPAGLLASTMPAAARMAQSDAAARRNNLALIGKGYESKADAAIAQAASDARATIAKRPANIQELMQQLTTNRQTGIANVANVLSARDTYRQNEATRKMNVATRRDTLRQRAIENKAAAAKVIEDARRYGIESERADITTQTQVDYLNNTLRISEGQATGIDPVTKKPTFANQQAQREYELAQARVDQANKAQAAQDRGDNTSARRLWEGVNHYKSNADGTPQLYKGKLVPSTGYKLAADGQSVVALAKPGKGKGAFNRTLIADVTDRIAEGLKPDTDIKVYDPDNDDADDSGYVHSQGAATNYTDALRTAIAAGPNTRAWRNKATTIVQNAYPAGHNGRPPLKLKPTTASQKALNAAVGDWKDQQEDEDMDYPTALAALRDSVYGENAGIRLSGADRNFYLPTQNQLQIAAYRNFYSHDRGR